MEKIKVGILGLGIVGTGVYKTLQKFSDKIEIVKIAVKNLSKKRDIDNIPEGLVTGDPYEIINNPNIQIIIEVIGGIDPIFDYVKKSLENGKHVVSANKELIAKKYDELAELCQKYNKLVLYESSTCATVPLINPIKTILSANSISKISGLLNVTTNIILQKIGNEKLNFADALKITQDLGFAEANPKNDVEGYDSMFKLINLSVISFKKSIKNFDKIYREGITKISARNMENAEKLGYKIKLLAQANFDQNSKKYDIRVHPCLLRNSNLLANFEATNNGVIFEGFPMGEIMISGKAKNTTAGFFTASGVVGDVLCIANELACKKEGTILPMMQMEKYDEIEMLGIEETYNKYYFELNIENDGQYSDLLAELGAFGIKMEKYLVENKTTFIITNTIQEKVCNAFVEKLKEKKIGIDSIIRVEV